MKSTLILTLCLAFFGVTASAAPATKFSCSNVGGTEEWTIYVDLDKKLAGFFDNDSTAVVPFKSMRMLESLPPQMLYTFEGQDAGSAGKKIRISFNKTRKSASVTLSLGLSTERTLTSQDGCEVDEGIVLE
jgi:hypothetical protein